MYKEKVVHLKEEKKKERNDQRDQFKTYGKNSAQVEFQGMSKER